jgi:type II secretory pathway pseudopilin PulG
MIKRQNGYTVIELIFVVIILAFAGILFFIQKNNVEIVAKDNHKKIAINAMYYGLEEVFYPANRYYPQTIDSDNLKSVDPALFTDPEGVKLEDPDSKYKYQPTNCNEGKCKSYTLRADLTNEADYTKKSRNN